MKYSKKSNFNGLGWGSYKFAFYVVIVPFRLFIQKQERFYLLYSLYALINAINYQAS